MIQAGASSAQKRRRKSRRSSRRLTADLSCLHELLRPGGSDASSDATDERPSPAALFTAPAPRPSNPRRLTADASSLQELLQTPPPAATPSSLGAASSDTPEASPDGAVDGGHEQPLSRQYGEGSGGIRDASDALAGEPGESGEDEAELSPIGSEPVDEEPEPGEVREEGRREAGLTVSVGWGGGVAVEPCPGEAFSCSDHHRYRFTFVVWR